MREPLEHEYFNWLCAKVLNGNRHNYKALMQILYKTEFVWVISSDKNRAEDGVELRLDFMNETCSERDHIWEREPCSLLEFFIAFAKRASFQTDTPLNDWFWIFMANLQLDQFRHASDSDISIIEDTLTMFMWRTYSPNGVGGMFPMRYAQDDQREIEVWYQFFEYLDHEGLL